MLDLLVAATLHFASPCDVLGDGVDSAYFSTCVTSELPELHAGSVVLDKFRVEPDGDWDEATVPLGFVKYRKVGPDPADTGYYAERTMAACVTPSGAYRLAGYGPLSFWSVASPPIVVASLAFTEDSCLPPDKRVALHGLGYSEDLVDPDYVPGWLDGTAEAWGLGYVVTGADYALHATSYNFTVTVSGNTCTSSNTTIRYNCFQSTWGPYQPAGFTGGVHRIYYRYTDGTYGSSPGEVSYDQFGTASFKTYTLTVAAGKRLDKVVVIARNGSGEGATLLTFYPEGHPSYIAGSDGYTWQVHVIESSALNEFIYKEAVGTYEYPDGVCDSMTCVADYCEGYGLDVPGMLKCLVVPHDVDFGEVWQSYVDALQQSAPYLVLSYGYDMLTSFGANFASFDGLCGDLGPTSGRFADAHVSTCGLPQASMVRAILSAAVWIMFAFAAWRTLSTLVLTWRATAPKGSVGAE